MQSKRASTRLIRSGICAISLTGFAAAASLNLIAQQQATAPAVLTTGDYARAEKFMGYNTTPLVLHSGVHATWLPDDRFWYRDADRQGQRSGPDRSGNRRAIACDLPACVDHSEKVGAAGRGNAPLSYARSPDGTQEALHPRLESLGSRCCHRKRNAAHHRRREGFRLRDRQRRLDSQRPADRSLVARLEEDRDISAGPARRRRDVSRRDQGRPPEAGSMEIPVAGRQSGHDDSARHHRCRGRRK